MAARLGRGGSSSCRCSELWWFAVLLRIADRRADWLLLRSAADVRGLRFRECLRHAGGAVVSSCLVVLRVPYPNWGGDRSCVSLVLAPLILVVLVVRSCLPAGLGRPQASALGSRP